MEKFEDGHLGIKSGRPDTRPHRERWLTQAHPIQPHIQLLKRKCMVWFLHLSFTKARKDARTRSVSTALAMVSRGEYRGTELPRLWLPIAVVRKPRFCICTKVPRGLSRIPSLGCVDRDFVVLGSKISIFRRRLVLPWSQFPSSYESHPPRPLEVRMIVPPVRVLAFNPTHPLPSHVMPTLQKDWLERVSFCLLRTFPDLAHILSFPPPIARAHLGSRSDLSFVAQSAQASHNPLGSGERYQWIPLCVSIEYRVRSCPHLSETFLKSDVAAVR
jgi:hypothetical protein